MRRNRLSGAHYLTKLEWKLLRRCAPRRQFFSCMKMSVADPSTTARWSAAMIGDKIVPQWSLRQSCLCTVKDSVLGYSRGRRNSVGVNENPFLQYPIDLRHELLNHLLRLKPTGRELLKAAQLLVSDGIPAFDTRCLDDCKFEDVRSVLETLAKTGVCLRELVLAGQWLYHNGGDMLLQTMLRSCPNLQCLTLQQATANELRTVLQQCPHLRKLEVLHPSLGEEDVQCLAREMHGNSAFDDARNLLAELRLPSSVSGRGVLELIHALPNVQYISFTHLDPLIDVLEDLPEEDTSIWKERTSRILGLHASLPVCPDTPELLVHWFPALEELSLEVQEDMELAPLSGLTNLRSLELKNSPTLPISYMDEVLPLLASCGKKLLSLSLERFDLIDLAKTTSYCPNLRSFSAQWFTILSTSLASRQQFLNLRYLRLRPRVGRKVSPEACEILLTHSRRLKHLEFYCSYGLTDALVNRLLRSNKFTELRTLLLRHGHGLSSAGIAQLTRNALGLRVWDVGMIYCKA